jgi:hypothetical protein
VSDFLAFAFCAATGFAFAAMLSHFYQWVTAERADFSLTRTSPLGLAMTVVLSMFAGPFIVCQKVLAGLRSREIPALQALFGAVVAGMWSVCAGIFYLSLLLAV